MKHLLQTFLDSDCSSTTKDVKNQLKLLESIHWTLY